MKNIHINILKITLFILIEVFSIKAMAIEQIKLKCDTLQFINANISDSTFVFGLIDSLNNRLISLGVKKPTENIYCYSITARSYRDTFFIKIFPTTNIALQLINQDEEIFKSGFNFLSIDSDFYIEFKTDSLLFACKILKEKAPYTLICYKSVSDSADLKQFPGIVFREEDEESSYFKTIRMPSLEYYLKNNQLFFYREW